MRGAAGVLDKAGSTAPGGVVTRNVALSLHPGLADPLQDPGQDRAGGGGRGLQGQAGRPGPSVLPGPPRGKQEALEGGRGLPSLKTRGVGGPGGSCDLRAQGRAWKRLGPCLPPAAAPAALGPSAQLAPDPLGR